MLASQLSSNARRDFIVRGLRDVGYRAGGDRLDRRGTWRLSPNPLELRADEVSWLRVLGVHLHAFNRECSRLYLDSVAGRQPRWIAAYLDQGKPGALVEYARKHQARRAWPTVIRPDIIPLPDGMWITELDAVPGGMGLIARAAEVYRSLGHELVGDHNTLPAAFSDMVKVVTRSPSPRLAIVVSEESADYRPEMTWLAQSLASYGVAARTVAPQDLKFSDAGVALDNGGLEEQRVDAVYRFFELFDLPNISHVDELMTLNARNKVAVIPPFRPFLEEKMWAALFHHPALAPFWIQALGPEARAFLEACTPPTWILDPAPLPPHATIPGLCVRGGAASSWNSLMDLGRAERTFVIKPSGFSERAWGSRGVVVGDDVSTQEWNAALGQALAAFPESPHVLQVFRAGRRFEGQFYDEVTGDLRTLEFRVRLSPYYLVVGDDVRLTAVMATMCPLDKKKLHGMPDAIIVPCSIAGSATGGA